MSHLTHAVTSFSDTLLKRIQDPFAISLGLGLAAGSMFAIGNITDQTWGVASLALNEKQRRMVGLEHDLGKCVELWAWQWKKGSTYMTIASVTSALSYVAAGFIIPVTDLTAYPRNMRRFVWATGLASLLPLAWSLVAVLPLDTTLLSTADKLTKSRSMTPAHSSKTVTPSPGASSGGVYPAKASGAGSTETAMNFSEERELQQLMDSWQTRASIRTTMSVVAWGMGLAALLVAY